MVLCINILMVLKPIEVKNKKLKIKQERGEKREMMSEKIKIKMMSEKEKIKMFKSMSDPTTNIDMDLKIKHERGER